MLDYYKALDWWDIVGGTIHNVTLEVEFCGVATPFNVLNEDKTDLSPCFQYTLFSGVICLLMMIFGSYWLWLVCKNDITAQDGPRLPFLLICSLMMAFCNFLHLMLSFINALESYLNFEQFGTSINGISWLICCWILHAERKLAAVNTGLGCKVFWVATTLANLKMVLSALLGKTGVEIWDVSRLMYYFCLIELPLHWIILLLAFIRCRDNATSPLDRIGVNSKTIHSIQSSDPIWRRWLDSRDEPVTSGTLEDPLISNSSRRKSNYENVEIKKVAVKSRINSKDHGKRTTQYAILVQTSDRSWTSWKKREDFGHLHSLLSNHSTRNSIKRPPKAPEMRYSKGSNSECLRAEDEDKYIRILNKYLSAVYKRREYRETILEFFDFTQATKKKSNLSSKTGSNDVMKMWSHGLTNGGSESMRVPVSGEIPGHQRLSLNVQENKDWVVSLRKKLRANIVIKDRTTLLKTFHDCFVGREAVDWLVSSGEAKSRQEAVHLGQMLLSQGIIMQDSNEGVFRDTNAFYRFAGVASNNKIGLTAISQTIMQQRGAQVHIVSPLNQNRREISKVTVILIGSQPGMAAGAVPTFDLKVTGISSSWTITKSYQDILALEKVLIKLHPQMVDIQRKLPKKPLMKKLATKVQRYFDDLTSTSTFQVAELFWWLELPSRDEYGMGIWEDFQNDESTTYTPRNNNDMFKSDESITAAQTQSSPAGSQEKRRSHDGGEVKDEETSNSDDRLTQMTVKTKETNSTNTSLSTEKRTTDQMKREVLIRSFESNKETGHTVFNIEVREFISTNEYLSWTVRKRFSQFVKLKKDLKDSYPKEKLPKLPPKGINQKDQTVMTERTISLEVFLQRLISNTVVKDGSELQAFLGMKDPSRNFEVHAMVSLVEAQLP